MELSVASAADDEIIRPDERVGDVFGKTYRVLRRIGSGGSSDVYAVEHLRLESHFALKIMRPTGSARSLRRFRSEIRALAALQNDHVVRVVDAGEHEGTPYLVMELLQGCNLRELLTHSAPLPISRAVHLMLDACRGVAAVHRAQLVHRDLKPENLFVVRRATCEDVCKVLDFGVVKIETSQSTLQGAIIGTVRYMAPEQLTDSASVSPATDVYALGSILYECLTGRTPHTGQTVQELMFNVMNKVPEPVTRVRPEVPPALERCIAKALAHSQAARHKTVEAFAADLERSLAPGARKHSASFETTHAEENKFGRRMRQRVYLAGGVAATLAGFGLGWFAHRTHVSGAISKIEPSPVRQAVTAKEAAPARVRLAPPSIAPVASVGVEPVQAPVAPATRRTNRSLPSNPRPQRADTRHDSALPLGHVDRENPYRE